MSAGENKAVLERGAKAFNTPEDRSGWMDIHDRSVVAHGLAEKPLDFDGVKKFYETLWEAFPDLRIAVEDMLSDGDKIALRLTASGTHRGEFKGIPATGTKVAFGATYIFRFRNGKIIERWTSLDRLGLLSQLGAMRAAA